MLGREPDILPLHNGALWLVLALVVLAVLVVLPEARKL
jgi:hypothetical protein